MCRRGAVQLSAARGKLWEDRPSVNLGPLTVRHWGRHAAAPHIGIGTAAAPISCPAPRRMRRCLRAGLHTFMCLAPRATQHVSPASLPTSGTVQPCTPSRYAAIQYRCACCTRPLALLQPAHVACQQLQQPTGMLHYTHRLQACWRWQRCSVTCCGVGLKVWLSWCTLRRRACM